MIFTSSNQAPNIAVKWDWLTAGFARLQPAPYLKR
jgi:hypothetical protein